MIYSKMLTYEFYKITVLMFLNFFVKLQSYWQYIKEIIKYDKIKELTPLEFRELTLNSLFF